MSTRIRTGVGRVEFLTHRQEIYKLLSKGHTAIFVYEELKAAGKLTLSYPSFTALLRLENFYIQGKLTPYVSFQGKTNPVEIKENTFSANKKQGFIRTEKSHEEKF